MRDKPSGKMQIFTRIALGSALAIGLDRLVIALGRTGIQLMTNSVVTRLLSDEYEENMWELVHSTLRITPQLLVETALRAQAHGDVIARPLGSRHCYDQFDKLLFDFAQLARTPRPAQLPVDTHVIIGPRARHPLRLEIPIIISGMAYGLALTARAKLAFAQGAAMVGTATNSGEGIPAPGEMAAAGKYIYQISRSGWNRRMAEIVKADAIEIQLGQGATGGTGHPIKTTDLPRSSRAQFHGCGRRAVHIYTAPPEMETPQDLAKMVSWVRSVTDVPIGVKIGAGKYLEDDLRIITDAGVDYIWVDGGQAGSHAAAPILQDDHGLPTFFALCRAVRFLSDYNLKGKITLIVSGGLFTPGDFLKCLALGADAVGIGTTALLAISHDQVSKYMPWEPPTQVTYATGKLKARFNWKMGAKHLAYYLQSCANEMAVSARAMGKAALSQVNRDDLISVDPYVARVAGVAAAHIPPPPQMGYAAQPPATRQEHWMAHNQMMQAESVAPLWKQR